MNTPETIRAKVHEIVAKHLDRKPSEVTDTALLTEDLDADSLDHVEITMAVEEAFGISIPDDLAVQASTVGHFVGMAEAAMAQRAEART